ncbi:phosphodiester glycosidase family protein [bacterium]|nr:phosphodiester glycosidase family protein [bacterium]
MGFLWRTIFILFLWTPQVWAGTWQNLALGLNYQKIETGGTVLHAFKIDPNQYTIKPVMALPGQINSVKTMADKNAALLVINANFFDEQGKPLGLIKKDGQVLNALKKVSWWGVMSFEKSRIRIIHTSEFADSAKVISALQAGPRLVVNGITPKIKEETSPKTAIGLTHDHQVVIVVSQSFVSINKLADLLSQPEEKGGLGLVDALNLDGGSSTQIYAKIGNFELSLPSYVELPSGLGVFNR